MTQTFQNQSDELLLRAYVAGQDRDAFAELVRRHIAFVRAAARRQVRGDFHLADDVTQAVFIVLARRADSIRVPLAAWLFTVTRHAAGNLMRSRNRQTTYLKRFADQQSFAAPPQAASIEHDEDRAAVCKHLDDSLARLPSLERSGILLHFFKGATHAEVGAALGLSADAARKRISRALEKMRDLLISRGVLAGSVALVAALREEATASAAEVPADLIASTANVATIAASSTAAASAPVVIADSVARVFALAKLKVAAAAMIAVTTVGGIALYAATQRAVTASTPIAAALTTTTLQPAQEPGKFTAKIDDKTSVEFLGVSMLPANETSWFTVAGEPCEAPDVAPMRGGGRRGEGGGGGAPGPTHTLALKIKQPTDAEVRLFIDGVTTMRVWVTPGDDNAMIMSAAFSPEAPDQPLDVNVSLSTEPWATTLTHENVAATNSFDGGEERGEVTLGEIREENGNAAVDISFSGMPGEPLRIVAVDEQGKEHVSNRVKHMNNNGESTITYMFDVPANQVKKLLAQTRKFTHKVTLHQMSLSPEMPTEPRIEVK